MLKTLTSLGMGFENDTRFTEPALYAVQNGFTCLYPQEVDPDHAPVSSHPPILYKTENHGATWEPYGQFIKTSGGYRLERFQT